jgi:PTH1 family peptidyl-tRNA hydrolase
MAEAAARVFVGLGNPGKKYERTRHNLGFMVVEKFAARCGWVLREEKRCSARTCKGMVRGVMVHLMMPSTYMNDSGIAVRSYLDYFQISPQNLFVVVDDIYLDFGEMRLRLSGSSGGHNGLKSIEAHLGTPDYGRVKMGVGDCRAGALSDHVLSSFSATELEQLDPFVERGVTALGRLVDEDARAVMNEVNRRQNPVNGAGEP